MLPAKLLKMQSLAEFIKRPSQRKCKIAFDKKARERPRAGMSTKPTTAASGGTQDESLGGSRAELPILQIA